MRGYLFVVLLILFLASDLTFAQSVSVKSISDKDSKVLVREGWELVYTSDQFGIGDFALNNNGIIISTTFDNEYHLILLDNEHIKKGEKVAAKISKLRMNFPYFFNSGEKQVFGPCDKLYYEIDLEKFRVRRNRYPFKKNRSKDGIHYRQDIYYEGNNKKYDLGSASSFNENVKVQTQYLLDYRLWKIDTLYKMSHHKDVMNFNAISPFLQFEVSNDESFIYILDNINGLLIVRDEGKTIKEIELKNLGVKKSAFLKSFPINLRKDFAENQIYLIYAPLGGKKESIIFKVDNNGTIESMKSEKLQSASLGSKIHNGKLYTTFKIDELKKSAIYSIDIE